MKLRRFVTQVQATGSSAHFSPWTIFRSLSFFSFAFLSLSVPDSSTVAALPNRMMVQDDNYLNYAYRHTRWIASEMKLLEMQNGRL